MIDEPRLFPLLGFTAAIVDGAVMLSVEFATTREDYQAGLGETKQFVMMPDAAVSIGEALLQRGALLSVPPH